MIQIQQTIVRGCVYILSWNNVYNVSLKVCWELCMVCQIWVSLNICIRVLTGRHHFCIQSRRNGLRNRQVRTWKIYTESSDIEHRDLEQAWTSQDRRRVLQEINSSLHRTFNLINCEIRIGEGQYQIYSKEIEGYLTGNSHFSTHWHQAYIHNRSNWWRGRQVRTQDIYISVTNDEWWGFGVNADLWR